MSQSGGQRGPRQGGPRDRERGRGDGSHQDFRRREGHGSGYQQRGHGQGDSGGGRGDFRGGRGGRGRPQTKVNFISGNQMPAPLYEKQFPMLKEKYGEWKEFSENCEVVYNGPVATTCKKKIKISVNHFPLVNFQIPSPIYHYQVSFERVRKAQVSGGAEQKPTHNRGKKRGNQSKNKGAESGDGSGGAPQARRLPKPLPQIILQYILGEIVNKEKGFYGIVSDLSNNIYSTKPLEKIGIDLIYEVPLTQVDQTILQENDDGSIRVKFARTELDINSAALAQINEHLKSRGTWKGYDFDIPTKTLVEQILNAVVKTFPNYRYLALGRSNLIRWPTSVDDKGHALQNNVVCWKGISASIGMGWKPYLNIDIAHCALLEDKYVLEALETELKADLKNLSGWKKWTFSEALKLVKNVKVCYSPAPGKKFAGPITDILPTSVANTKFDLNGKQISVYDYYKKQYNKEVNPRGPCLLLRGKSQVPAELCIIKKGQSYNRRLNEAQTSNMLKLAKKNPYDLYKDIKTEMEDLRTKTGTTEAWGVHFDGNMLTLNETRVLSAPQLIYGKGIEENEGKGWATVVPEDGIWEIYSTSYTFLTPKTVKKWGILVAGSCNPRDINDYSISCFKNLLMNNGKSKGVEFEDVNPIIERADQLQDSRDNQNVARQNVEKLTQIFSGKFKDCQIVFVIIPRKNSALYSHVKQAAEIHVGALTQCVVAQNVAKGQVAIMQNILLKVNSKMGGRNYMVRPALPNPNIFDILDCPTLIIGADVTHPPPGTTRRVGNKDVPIPSFAAVTGSIDRTGMPFMMDIKAQAKAGRGAAEVIQNLDQIVLKMLREFERWTTQPNTPNGIRPRKIIYYRDGVGDGQFPEVRHVELNAIRKACNQLTDYDGGAYLPRITIITVQKRHKTRFFWIEQDGKISQAPAGTVVDSEIVHQTNNEFYLLSHPGMMGTSRPTRYHCLWDDSEFTADQLQNLTYYLCYMYVRCCKSVKIPAPTYYAHWAAARAKALCEGLEDLFDDLDNLNQRISRHEGFVKSFPMHFV